MPYVSSRNKNFHYFSMMSENSQTYSHDFNLPAFVICPTAELSPNMFVSQNIFKSAELTLPAVAINEQTQGKPKPQVMKNDWFLFLFPPPYVWLHILHRLPSVFGPWIRACPCQRGEIELHFHALEWKVLWVLCTQPPSLLSFSHN